ncbi:MAG: TonB-dependent receptor [Duncaniella sp.]|nr:TonB-dependent receptor [Duncaniella sp.]
MKDQNTNRGQLTRRFSFISHCKATIAILMLCLGLSVSAQNITVSGTVEDPSGEPLMGATVLVAGTTNGVATDLDGNFTLKNVSPKGKLEVSYVGYTSQTVAIDGRTSIKIVLKEDAELLDEVVVVGYGTMKKSDLTGSISSVGTEALNAKGAPSVLENLQGTTPGVNITKSTGRTNGGINIEIRGKSSIESQTTPLYVVDGVMCSDIDFLNPQDIERIDVLKDASSTAIYGSRATAGVVMITTKGGLNVSKNVDATITYDGYYGYNKVARMPEFADAKFAYNYRFLRFTESVGEGSQVPYTMKSAATLGQCLIQKDSKDPTSPYVLKEMLANGESYDWPGMVTKNGQQQNHYIAINGASERVSYHFGAGINSEDGIYEGDKSRLYTFKGSLDARINSVISGGFTFNAAYLENEYADDNAISQAYRTCTFFRPYDSEGNINHYPGMNTAFGTNEYQFSSFKSPLDLMQDSSHKKKTYRALGNIYIQLDFMKGFNFKSTFSPTFNNYRDATFSGYINPTTGKTYNDAEPETASAWAKNYTGVGYTWDNILNFNRTFNKIHSLNLMGLFSFEKSNSESYEMKSVGVMEGSDWWNLQSGSIEEGSGKSSYSEGSMISYALRANYGFKDRYLLTATMRWDGCSKFAKGHRWGSFPSVAFAWRASEEAFLRDIDWINNLKLRLSYGKTGNNKGVGNYATLVGIGGPVFYPFGNTLSSGFYPGSIVDLGLSWESSTEYNAGIDFGFLNSRISGSIDFYNKDSKDLLYNVELPIESGGGSMKTNIGKVRNRGVEIALTTVNITNRNFEWSTTFTFAHNNNKVREINGYSTEINTGNVTSVLMVGQPYGMRYGYAWDGIVTDQMMTVPDHPIAVAKGFTPGSQVRACDYYYEAYGVPEGGVIIRDVNGDGVYDENDKVVYNGDPKWTGSLTSNMNYNLPKNGGSIDFSFSLYAKQGNKVYAPFMNSDYYDYHDRGRGKMMFDYYIPAGALIDAGGVNADGTVVGAVYQQETHYGSYPFPTASGEFPGASKNQSQWNQAKAFVDGSFVKVKNITLGYTFHKNILKHIGCKNFRIYCTIANPFVWTKYKGFDPEWAEASTKTDGPSVVSYQVGASIKF